MVEFVVFFDKLGALRVFFGATDFYVFSTCADSDVNRYEGTVGIVMDEWDFPFFLQALLVLLQLENML